MLKQQDTPTKMLQFPIPLSTDKRLERLKVNSDSTMNKHEYSLYILEKGLDQEEKEQNK